jgi:AraC family transcriptional activator of pobA
MHCETMEFRSRMNNWVIRPHLHANLFQIFLIQSGKVSFLFADTRRIIRGSAIVTIPENTLHGLEVSKNIKGTVLTFSSSFLESLFTTTPDVLLELNAPRIFTVFKDRQIFDAIDHTVNDLRREMEEELPGKPLILHSHFNLLLGKIYRLSLDSGDKGITTDNRNIRYFNAFQRSVKQSRTPMRSIVDYARELNITSVHLNRICQATVGKSALQIVHDFLFLESEKYLKYTEYSISEIAYRLNFEDPAYFSRFFRKLSGSSPKQYRQRYASS